MTCVVRNITGCSHLHGLYTSKTRRGTNLFYQYFFGFQKVPSILSFVSWNVSRIRCPQFIKKLPNYYITVNDVAGKE